MADPENPEGPQALPVTTGEGTPPGEDTFVKQEDKTCVSQLMEDSKDRPLTPEERVKLNDKIKAYDSGYSRQRSELDVQKEEVARVLDELKKVRETTPATLKTAKADSSRLLDSLMEQTQDPASRETLRQLREIIRQETGLDGLRKDMTELRQLVDTGRQNSQQTRYQGLQGELKELTTRYGDALVEKHREAIISYINQNPSYTARRMLHMVADPDELDQALELRARSKPKQDGQEPPKGKVPSPTSTASEHPSEKFRGKKPIDIRRGFDNALAAAAEKAMGKLPGM